MTNRHRFRAFFLLFFFLVFVCLFFLLFSLQLSLVTEGKRSSLHTSQVAHQAGAYAGFLSMKQLGVFLLPPPPPPDGILVHYRVTPSIEFAGTHLYTWVKKRHCESNVYCPKPQLGAPA